MSQRSGNDKHRDQVREQVVSHAHRQVEVLEEATGLLGGLSEFLDQQSEQCEAVAMSMDRLDDEARRGSDELSELTAELRELLQVNRRLADSLGTLDRIHERIEAISEIITDIRMLGLNAAIEAARAGEKGQGFNVVASSMRELARSGARVAGDISELVRVGLAEVTELTEDTRNRIDARVGQADQVQHRFSGVGTRVTEARSIATGLADSARTKNQETQKARATMQQAMETHSGETARLIGAVTGVQILDLTVHEARGQLGEFVVIDVRTAKEWTDTLGHIDVAQHVPIADPDFESRLSALDPRAPTLFVCRSGGRSARAARMAVELGFKEVFNMAGGMLAWNEASLPIVKGRRAA